jgi:hypothetical protein
MTNDPEIYRRMYGVRTNYQKAEYYDALRFDPTRDNILSVRDNALHSELRSKVAAGVSRPSVQYAVRGSTTNILVR